MAARSELHTLEDLCEEQNDAMQEWLDTAREQPPPALSQAERDGLIARARDVYDLIAPSPERAMLLNKAYRVIVDEQSYLFGRDPPSRHV